MQSILIAGICVHEISPPPHLKKITRPPGRRGEGEQRCVLQGPVLRKVRKLLSNVGRRASPVIKLMSNIPNRRAERQRNITSVLTHRGRAARWLRKRLRRRGGYRTVRGRRSRGLRKAGRSGPIQGSLFLLRNNTGSNRTAMFTFRN